MPSLFSFPLFFSKISFLKEDLLASGHGRLLQEAIRMDARAGGLPGEGQRARDRRLLLRVG